MEYVGDAKTLDDRPIADPPYNEHGDPTAEYLTELRERGLSDEKIQEIVGGEGRAG